VTGYQFATGQSTSNEADWDASWLMIRGKIWDGTESWVFHDPCMTTWEAREFATWLRGLEGTSPAAGAAAEPGELRLSSPNSQSDEAASAFRARCASGRAAHRHDRPHQQRQNSASAGPSVYWVVPVAAAR